MGFRALLTLFFVNIYTHMNAKYLNFTITGKPIPGRCEKFQTKYSRWNYASCSEYWPSYFKWDLFGNEIVNGATVWQIQDTLESFEYCFNYDFFIGENLKRLVCSVLQPACIDVTTVNDDHTTSVVQVVPPYRSLCLELRRAFNPLEIYTSQCAGYLENCNHYPRPRDSNFVCVPPVFYWYS